MNRSANYGMRLAMLSLCALLMAVLNVVFPPAARSQQGGSLRIDASVRSGGGGRSTNGSTRLEGSAGQAAVDTSAAGAYRLESGFWPNAVPCPFALSSSAEFFTQAGGAGSVNVVAVASCSWTAAATDSWITLVSEGGGGGNETVAFEVRENFTGSARQAAINVSGLQHLIVQDAGLGADCGYELSPAFESFAAIGGGGTINLTADSRCAWQAVTSQSWITITSASVGIGSRTVSYSVAANPGGSGRKGTITIGRRAFAVKQKGN